jgi:hypothetical protein
VLNVEAGSTGLPLSPEMVTEISRHSPSGCSLRAGAADRLVAVLLAAHAPTLAAGLWHAPAGATAPDRYRQPLRADRGDG